MDQLYQQLILDHARERHGFGLPDAAVGHGAGESFQVNPTCGDEIRLRVRLSDDGDVLESVHWEGSGCSISQASASVLVDLVSRGSVSAAREHGERFGALMHSRGAAVDPAVEEALGDAAAFAGVSRYPARVKCALLGWMALQDAMARAGAAAGEHP